MAAFDSKQLETTIGVSTVFDTEFTMLSGKSKIQEWYEEDLPYGDLSSEILEIGQENVRILFRSRGEMVVAGTEIAGEVLEHAGILVESLIPSGQKGSPGHLILSALGPAASIHMAWRICLNLLEYSSGIATKASRLLDAAHLSKPGIAVNGTRKHIPGLRRFATDAARAGGVLPHRLGLSESILVFDQHLVLIGGVKALANRLGELKAKVPGKNIVVELKGGPSLEEEASLLARSGVDGLQFDKVRPEELSGLLTKLRLENSKLIFFVTGGIDEDNIGQYAATGVDAIVTSAVYHAGPADIGAQILPLAGDH